MAEVVCVGIAVLDRVFKVPVHAVVPGKYRATSRTVTGGGVAANAAVAIVRLGGRARFCGVVGDDETGTEIVRGLEDEGVDSSAVQAIPGGQSPESIVQIDEEGERLIVNHASSDLFDRAAPPSSGDLEGADAVLVDMRWRMGAITALKAARARNLPGIVDCDHDPSASPGILEEASHILFSASTLEAWTRQDELPAALQEAHRRTGAWVGATDGAEGTTWLDDGSIRRTPAFEVQAVDTLGAGDVFHGAFSLALAEGSDIDASLRWASAAAALKCTRFGGRTGIPRRADVETFLEDRWN